MGPMMGGDRILWLSGVILAGDKRLWLGRGSTIVELRVVDTEV